MPPPTAHQKAGETDIFKLDGTDICTLGLQRQSAVRVLCKRKGPNSPLSLACWRAARHITMPAVMAEDALQRVFRRVAQPAVEVAVLRCFAVAAEQRRRGVRLAIKSQSSRPFCALPSSSLLPLSDKPGICEIRSRQGRNDRVNAGM
jgi:hypothetical protein